MGLPKPSRETKFSGANGDREEFILGKRHNGVYPGKKTTQQGTYLFIA